MKDRRALSSLEDILDSITAIKDYTKGEDLTAFKRNKMMVDAVLRNIEIIGEAAKNIPHTVRKNHQGIPWKRIRIYPFPASAASTFSLRAITSSALSAWKWMVIFDSL